MIASIFIEDEWKEGGRQFHPLLLGAHRVIIREYKYNRALRMKAED